MYGAPDVERRVGFGSVVAGLGCLLVGLAVSILFFSRIHPEAVHKYLLICAGIAAVGVVGAMVRWLRTGGLLLGLGGGGALLLSHLVTLNTPHRIGWGIGGGIVLGFLLIVTGSKSDKPSPGVY